MIAAKDLLNETAERLGYAQYTSIEAVTLRTEHRKLLNLLNRVLETIGGYNDWPMLREESTVVTVASEQGDSDSSEFVTATQNSDTVTVANVTFSENYIGRAFQVSGDEYVYRITAVPAPTQLTINRAWVSASITVADELTYTIAMDRYALPTNFGREVDDWESFFGPYNIVPRTPNQFRTLRRENPGIQLGEPRYFTIYGLTNNQQIVHFHPWPENARMLVYDYQRRHPKITSDQDQVLFPATYMGSLIDLLIALAHRDLDDDSAKAQQVIIDWINSHNRQQSNPGPTSSRPVLQLANDVRQSIRDGVSFPHRIDWGDAFDNGSIYGL